MIFDVDSLTSWSDFYVLFIPLVRLFCYILAETKVVLVEGSEEYTQFRDQGADVLTEVFGNVIQPGDKIATIWMEVSNLGNDDALFYRDEVAWLPTPSLADEPKPNLISTPTPINHSAAVTAQQQHQNEVSEIERENKKILKAHNCQHVLPTRIANNQAIANWNSDQDEEISRVITGFSQGIDTVNPDVMSVFEALELASEIFQSVCEEGIYDDCQLIIVSSMIDWRTNIEGGEVREMIEDMEIDFSNISISVVWLECKFFTDLFQNKCGTRLETWQEHFASFGATEKKGNIVFLNQDNVVAELVDYLGGTK